jgi:hypothetical protein
MNSMLLITDNFKILQKNTSCLINNFSTLIKSVGDEW